ncbi:hypothetical protein SUDANB60_06271 (plasmid) [Streptomyces sp. enrichment culture]|uniref:hypothetical protein n=1 Tax=Streptomyces sp. enrichment culture TaxID=1795815 RepID=UPI003F547A82
MALSRVKLAALAGAVSGATMLVLSSAPASASELPGVSFYTGVNRTGTEMVAELGDPGVCHELSAPAASYLAISDRSVEVYFNSNCRTGAPETSGDLYYMTGTLGSGNFPYPALSYRVTSGA